MADSKDELDRLRVHSLKYPKAVVNEAFNSAGKIVETVLALTSWKKFSTFISVCKQSTRLPAKCSPSYAQPILSFLSRSIFPFTAAHREEGKCKNKPLPLKTQNHNYKFCLKALSIFSMLFCKTAQCSGKTLSIKN